MKNRKFEGVRILIGKYGLGFRVCVFFFFFWFCFCFCFFVLWISGWCFYKGLRFLFFFFFFLDKRVGV